MNAPAQSARTGSMWGPSGVCTLRGARSGDSASQGEGARPASSPKDVRKVATCNHSIAIRLGAVPAAGRSPRVPEFGGQGAGAAYLTIARKNRWLLPATGSEHVPLGPLTICPATPLQVWKSAVGSSP